MDSLPVSTVEEVASTQLEKHIGRIQPSLGMIESLTADSCKHIRDVLATDCINLPKSAVYWVWKEKPMKVRWLLRSYSYIGDTTLSTN